MEITLICPIIGRQRLYSLAQVLQTIIDKKCYGRSINIRTGILAATWVKYY